MVVNIFLKFFCYNFSVISVLKEPIRGWHDNLNGPVGLLVAGGKGEFSLIYSDWKLRIIF